MKLSGEVCTALMGIIGCDNANVPDYHKQMAAIQLKNTLKAIYGSTINYQDYNDKSNEQLANDDQIDEGGRQVLQQHLVPLMIKATASKNRVLSNVLLEIIGTMARRFVQNEWPSLLPSLIECLKANQDLNIYRSVFECTKKICKKYRFMFRSDDLYREMNYMIETFSPILLDVLGQCVQMAQDPQASQEIIVTIYGVMNAVLHVIQSIISQEELPDFYEQKLPEIT
mmetsp:Transcript_5909/g.9613  ORF Transcript_5909/g.9613 Transcript_5909/m.9613 type:complete len:227 (+) Transcript_5909:106-786(+)